MNIKSEISLETKSRQSVIDKWVKTRCQRGLKCIGHQAHGFQEFSHRRLLDAYDLNGVGNLVLHAAQAKR